MTGACRATRKRKRQRGIEKERGREGRRRRRIRRKILKKAPMMVMAMSEDSS